MLRRKLVGFSAFILLTFLLVSIADSKILDISLYEFKSEGDYLDNLGGYFHREANNVVYMKYKQKNLSRNMRTRSVNGSKYLKQVQIKTNTSGNGYQDQTINQSNWVVQYQSSRSTNNYKSSNVK